MTATGNITGRWEPLLAVSVAAALMPLQPSASWAATSYESVGRLGSVRVGRLQDSVSPTWYGNDERPAEWLVPTRYVPRTALGSRLLAAREKMKASGVALLDLNQLETEIASRRDE